MYILVCSNPSEITSSTEQSSSKPIEDKLIDFGADAAINSDEMSTNLNNNFLDSNSSLITHNLNNSNNNNLVAASNTNDGRGN